MVGGLLDADPAQVGPYRLLGRLGAGGMGRVYLGRSAGGRLVAVKVVRADLAEDAEFRARFAQEVAAARTVSGLFTAAVVDADVEGQTPWLATAYVAGPSLSEAVRQHGPLPAASVLPLTAGLAEGLAAVHSVGLVHRDLKPANVLLAEDGPRVIDFGISRAAEANSLTRSGMVVGSPGFMSPEQAQGHEVGPASDVFSLGAVITFAATGHGPFGDGQPAALMYRVVHGEPDTGELPAQIRALVESCLGKDPAARPTAAEVLAKAQALAEASAGQTSADWLPDGVAAAVFEYRAALPFLPDAVASGEAQAVAPGRRPRPADAGKAAPGTRRRRPGTRRRLPAWAWTVAAIAVAVPAIAAAAMASGPGTDPPRRQPVSHQPLAASRPDRSQHAARASAARPTAGPEVSHQPARLVASRGTVPSASPRPSRSSSGPPPSSSPSASPTSSSGPASPPATPIDVSAAADGEYVIEVTWSESMTGVTGIAVDNGCPAGDTGCGTGATLAETAGPVTHAEFAVTPGTYECFRVRAFNSAGSSDWSGYGCASTPGLTVPGTQQWTGTGVTVSAGEEVGITAAGQIYVLSSLAEGPAGDPLCIPQVTYPTTKLPFPAPSLTCWSLIARIGSGTPFEVGASALVTAQSSGTLYLGVNDDDISAGSGSWTARIKLGGLPPAA